VHAHSSNNYDVQFNHFFGGAGVGVVSKALVSSCNRAL
jgi:hypothetical protein